jgi:cell division septation protein DedD
VALMFSTASLDVAAQVAMSIAAFVLILVGGPIAVETLSHGRSLGKLAFGLRVVRDDGGPIRFRHALVRGAIGVVEILMTVGVVACIASLVSARGRRLGDVFAGTLVVRERVSAGQTAFVPPPPPWLTGRFAELDLSAVPDGLWLAIRQYLTRMQQLDPQVGWAMAERLAADLVARTGAPAPQGVPSAAYLAAVVQERQARDVRRAFGNGAVGGVPAGGFRPGAGVPGAFGNSAPQPSPAPQQPYGSAPAPAPASWPAAAAPPVPAAGGTGANPVAPGTQPPAPPSAVPAAPKPSTGFAPPA